MKIVRGSVYDRANEFESFVEETELIHWCSCLIQYKEEEKKMMQCVKWVIVELYTRVRFSIRAFHYWCNDFFLSYDLSYTE